MKKIFTFLFTLSLFTCSSNQEENKKNGFSPDGGKFEIGSQSSIDIVSKFHDAYLIGDKETMKSIISDTIIVNYHDGKRIKGSDSLVDYLGEDFSIQDTSLQFIGGNPFKPKFIFSVALENDTKGEWVIGQYEFKGILIWNDELQTYDGQEGTSHLIDSYYVIDNKITRWNSSERLERY